MKTTSLRCSFFMIAALGFSGAAYADGEQDDVGHDVASVTESSSNETSPQVLDKRMPPVVPGQEVTVNGKKMKVWSTAGEVPVAQAPEPWEKDSSETKQELQGLGVVIDGRPRIGNRPR